MHGAGGGKAHTGKSAWGHSGRTWDLLTDNGELVVFPFQSVQAVGEGGVGE